MEEKPKRVLTEAQRLAFLKGREKRLANIERKRQEQMELDHPPVEEIPEETVEPPVVETPVVAPTPKREWEPDELAHAVADLVIERMKKSKPPTPPPPKPATPPPRIPKQEFLWC
jgi:hypothetical protein